MFSDRFIKRFMCRMCCIFTILSPTGSSRDSCAACVVFSQYVLRQVHQGIHVPHVLYFHNMFPDRFIKGFMCRMCCIFTICSPTGSSRDSCAACVVFSQYVPRQVHQGIHVPHVLYFHNMFPDRFIKGFMCRMCCIFTICSPTGSSRDSCAACVVFSQYVPRQVHQGIHVPHVLYFHNMFPDRFIKGFMCRMCCIFTICSPTGSSRDSCAACVVFSQYVPRQVHQGIHVPHVLYFHNMFPDRFIKGFMCRMCCIFTICSPTGSSRDSCAASSRSARRTATSSSTPRLTTWRDCAELSRATCSTRSGYLPRNSCTKYDPKQTFNCTAHSF